MKKELFMEKSPRRGLKNKASRILINILVTLVLGLLYFYVSLPAINLHDSNFYGFFFVLCIIYVVCALITSGFHMDASGGIKEYFRFIKSQCLPIGILMLLLIVIAILGTVISMPIFRAASYRDLLTVENGDFAAEVEEISFDQIPMLDEQSAQRLGDRKRVCANVDMYSGLIYQTLGIPEDLFTPLFAVARMAGWCAHRIEELTTGGRIMRPAYRALPVNQRYVPLNQRG